MKLFKRLKNFFRNPVTRCSAGRPAVISAVVAAAPAVSPEPPADALCRASSDWPALSTFSADQLDLALGQDLDHVMRGVTVPKETLEKWIASGFLYPEEVRVAEKLLRLMRNPTRFIPSIAAKPQ